jgi:hypothetical protein
MIIFIKNEKKNKKNSLTNYKFSKIIITINYLVKN